MLNLLSIVSNLIEDLGNPELEWGRITFFLILALGVSFICSLLEAIILSVTWSHIEILNKDEKSLGTLFTFFILETILLGRLLKVNPFDQPAVELIKKETKKILLRKTTKNNFR